MSLNISTNNVTSHTQPGQASGAGTVGNRFIRRPAADQVQGAEDVSKARSPADQPERPQLRPHPAAATEESLQRLPEANDSARYKLRARKGTNEPGASPSDESGAVESGKARSPYDPPRPRQRDLDMLA
jgi:hypothetical protein